MLRDDVAAAPERRRTSRLSPGTSRVQPQHSFVPTGAVPEPFQSLQLTEASNLTWLSCAHEIDAAVARISQIPVLHPADVERSRLNFSASAGPIEVSKRDAVPPMKISPGTLRNRLQILSNK